MLFQDETILRMKKLLQCGHCQEVLQNPLTLMECQHNFCSLCLEEVRGTQKKTSEMIKAGGVLCPVCKEFSEEKDVRANPIVIKVVKFHNHVLKEKADREAAKRKQRIKKSADTAVWKCVDCPLYMCDDCKKKHLKVPIFKGHYTIPIGRKGSSSTAGNHGYYEAPADYPVKYFCIECDEGICDGDLVGHLGEKLNKQYTIAAERGSVVNGPGNFQTLDPYDTCMETLDRSLEEKIAQVKRDHDRRIMKLNRERERQKKELDEASKKLIRKEKEMRQLTDIAQATLLQQASDPMLNNEQRVTLLHRMTNGGLMKRLEEASKNKPQDLEIQLKKPYVQTNDTQWKKMEEKGLLGRIGYKTEELVLPGSSRELVRRDTMEQTNDK